MSYTSSHTQDHLDDEITIEEEGPVFTLASWKQRAIAYLIDYLCAYIFVICGGLVSNNDKTSASYRFFLLLALVFLGWNFIRQGRTGQTVGKQFMGIQVVGTATAEFIGPRLSLVRGLIHGLVDAVATIGIGYLLPLGDSQRQTITDKILNTVVIVSPERIAARKLK